MTAVTNFLTALFATRGNAATTEVAGLDQDAATAKIEALELRNAQLEHQLASLLDRLQEIVSQTRGPVDADRSEDLAYTLSVDEFFNARHRVMLNGTFGPLHSHSWRVNVRLRQIELTDEHLLLGFADAKALLKEEISAFNGTVLNDMPAFAEVPPTTENVAAFLHSMLRPKCEVLTLELESVTVWENPTNSVTFGSAQS